jgi:hypothetical protein
MSRLSSRRMSRLSSRRMSRLGSLRMSRLGSLRMSRKIGRFSSLRMSRLISGLLSNRSRFQWLLLGADDTRALVMEIVPILAGIFPGLKLAYRPVFID